MRKKRTSVVHRICTLVGSLFCFILIPLLLINCTLMIKSITNKNEVPDIGGIFPMVILTDSMNPQLASGDLVICRKVNARTIKTGDVILQMRQAPWPGKQKATPTIQKMKSR